MDKQNVVLVYLDWGVRVSLTEGKFGPATTSVKLESITLSDISQPPITYDSHEALKVVEFRRQEVECREGPVQGLGVGRIGQLLSHGFSVCSEN